MNAFTLAMLNLFSFIAKAVPGSISPKELQELKVDILRDHALGFYRMRLAVREFGCKTDLDVLNLLTDVMVMQLHGNDGITPGELRRTVRDFRMLNLTCWQNACKELGIKIPEPKPPRKVPNLRVIFGFAP